MCSRMLLDLLPATLFPQDPWTQRMMTAARQMSAANYVEAEKEFQAAAKMAEAFDDDDLRRARTLNNIGALYHNMGRYEEAERNYKAALVIYKKQPDAPDSAIAAALNNLGEANRIRGHLTEAGEYFRQSLAAYEKLGSKSSDLASICNNYAVFLNSTGRYPESEVYARRALEGWTEKDGPESRRVGEALNTPAEAMR